MIYNQECNSTTFKTNSLFNILNKNMFNLKKKDENSRICSGSKIYHGHHSYIHTLKWDNFKNHLNESVEIAKSIRQNINEYNIVKTVNG